MTKPRSVKSDFRTHDRWLIVALNLGPLSVLSNVLVSYALAEESCLRGSKWMLHASAGTFFLLALSASVLARWASSRLHESEGPESLVEHSRWLTTAAYALGVFAALVIVAMEIPNLILGSCD
jgi:hypothetical protein